MRIGIDLGGTKTEVIALSDQGAQLFRHRLPTPGGDYRQTIETIASLVEMAEQATGQSGTVGIGIPGSISPYTGVVKNANSTWLNGQPFDKDLSQRLNREVRLANDANCLAVSEAVDGAAAGAQTVFAVIIGTGCGAGVAFGGRSHIGGNGTAGGTTCFSLIASRIVVSGGAQTGTACGVMKVPSSASSSRPSLAKPPGAV